MDLRPVTGSVTTAPARAPGPDLSTFAIAVSLVFVVAVVVWLARGEGGAPPDAPLTLAEVVPTLEDNERQIEMVTLQPIEGKGLGVRALVHIPAWTCLGPYPGAVCTLAQHAALKARGEAEDQYAIEFWDGAPGGAMREDVVVNPMVGGGLPDKYMCATPFVNEPGLDEAPNLAWVWNFPKHRVEMWTTRDVKAGEELTICYGQAYARRYGTKCTQAGVEAPRLAIGAADQARPLEWHEVVGDDNAVPVGAAAPGGAGAAGRRVKTTQKK